jgi:hypothetical protein
MPHHEDPFLPKLVWLPYKFVWVCLLIASPPSVVGGAVTQVKLKYRHVNQAEYCEEP